MLNITSEMPPKNERVIAFVFCLIILFIFCILIYLVIKLDNENKLKTFNEQKNIYRVKVVESPKQILPNFKVSILITENPIPNKINILVFWESTHCPYPMKKDDFVFITSIEIPNTDKWKTVSRGEPLYFVTCSGRIQ